jgi:hypothetical protein
VWLSWDLAALLALALAAPGLAVRHPRLRRWGEGRWAGLVAFTREASLVAALYAVWQWVGTLPARKAENATGHGLWVWHLEQRLHLASELRLERWALPHPLVIQAANAFYAIVHVPALGVFLVWLYFRHRDRYPLYRNTLAVLTFVCFAIHLYPVAPPRLIPGLGFVDTGLLYHQSVYGPMGAGISDQVSAMPSLHVAWACLIALAVIHVGRGRWRWLIILHPVLTTLAVVVTANHFWLDGIVAAVLLGLSLLAVQAAGALSARVRAGRTPPPDDQRGRAVGPPPPDSPESGSPEPGSPGSGLAGIGVGGVAP